MTDNYYINQTNFKNALIKFYGKCIFSDTKDLKQCVEVCIIPNNILGNKNNKVTILYNGLLMRKDVKISFESFAFSIIPEPIEIRLIDSKLWTMVSCIADGDLSIINGKKICILYSSLFFVKWHYHRYLEIRSYKSSENIFSLDFFCVTTNSDKYLNETIKQIKYINNECAYDSDKDIVMLPVD